MYKLPGMNRHYQTHDSDLVCFSHSFEKVTPWLRFAHKAMFLYNQRMKSISVRHFSALIGLFFIVSACAAPLVAESAPVRTATLTIAPAETVLISLTPRATTTPAPTASPSPQPTRIPDNLPLSMVSYRLPLTIRHITEDHAELLFELSEPAAGTIFLYTSQSSTPTHRFELDAKHQRHQILMDALQPGTTYRVVVVLEENGQLTRPAFQSRAWAPVALTTLPEQPAVIRVGVLGDASFGDDATTALIDLMARSDLDFVLNLGDVVDETTFGIDPFESYAQKFYTPFEPLLQSMPVYTVPGNHDYDPDLTYLEFPFYAYAFPPFSADDLAEEDGSLAGQFAALPMGDIQFLLLDAMAIIGQPGREAQQAWLEERLSDSNYTASIPIFHVSPFSSSVVHPEDSSFTRTVWVPQFEQSGTVPLVLSGHFHHYERLLVNDITYLVSGGGSSILYASGPTLPESQVFARQTHFVLLEIRPDGIELSAIALDGSVIDTDSIPLGN